MNLGVKNICLIFLFLLLCASVEKEPGTTKPKPKPPAYKSPNPTAQPQTRPAEEKPKIGKEYHPSGTKGGSMVYVPAGEFWMGSDPNDALKECQKHGKDCQRSWFENEGPQHLVFLEAFYIDKYEVTQGEYNECVSSGACRPNQKYDGFSGDRQPVVGVSWDDAKNYCEWAGKRLPTEAEWERAARGADGRIYPWGNEFDGRRGNFCDKNCLQYWAKKTVDDGYSITAPVGSYPGGASPYGAMDMAGNVWEWVADWYDERYYSNSPNRNPKGPDSGNSRVLRSSGWNTFARFLRASARFGFFPSSRSSTYGFRCLRD